jgi:hypothetical protein
MLLKNLLLILHSNSLSTMFCQTKYSANQLNRIVPVIQNCLIMRSHNAHHHCYLHTKAWLFVTSCARHVNCFQFAELPCGKEAYQSPTLCVWNPTFMLEWAPLLVPLCYEHLHSNFIDQNSWGISWTTWTACTNTSYSPWRHWVDGSSGNASDLHSRGFLWLPGQCSGGTWNLSHPLQCIIHWISL